MNKFVALTKVSTIAALRQMNFLRRRSANRQGAGSLYMVVIFAIVIMVYMGWLANVISRVLYPAGLLWLMMAMLFFIIFALVFATNLYTVNSVLFESKDIEPLLACPIPKYQILFAKISGLLAMNWLFSFLLAIPFVAVYGYYAHPAFVFYPFALVGTLISPLIPLALNALISYLVSALTSGARFKSFLNILLTFVMVAALIYGVVTASSHISGMAVSSSGALLTDFKKIYPPLGYAVSALTRYSFPDLLLAVLWNVVPFVLVCWLLSVRFTALRSRIASSTHKVKSGRLSYNASTTLKTLLRKEYARFLHSPMYIIQSCVGILIMTVFAIVGSIGGGTQLPSLLASVGASPLQITLVFFCIFLSICTISAPSVSLEGKSLWIVLSSPLRPVTALRAKLLLHLCTLCPIVLIDCVLAAFSMSLGAGGFFLLLGLSLLFTILGGIVGLCYNLRFHRFDFDNDMQVVKNSASVQLTMVTMLVIAGALALLYGLLYKATGLNFTVYAIVLLVVLALASGYLYRYLCTKGAAVFRQLS